MKKAKGINKKRRDLVFPASTTDDANNEGDSGSASVNQEQIDAAIARLPEEDRRKLTDNPAAMAAVALFVGVALTGSKPSYAQAGLSAGAIAKAVAKAIQTVMKPILDALSQTLQRAFGASVTAASDKVATAVGQAGQATIESMKDVHDEEVLQSSRPAPASCVTDGTSKVMDYGQRRAGKSALSQGVYIANEIMKGGTAQAGVAKDEMTKREADYPNDEDLVAAIVLKASGYTPKESKTAQAFLRRIRGKISVDNITLSDNEKKTDSGNAFQFSKTSMAARAGVGLAAFNEAAARRETSPEMAKAIKAALDAENDPTEWDKKRIKEMTEDKNGVSLLDVMTYEVDRRYKNPDWRELMADPPSSVPVMREVANMLAFQNHLLFEQYKQSELAMSIDASNLVSMMEKESEKMITDYATNSGA